MSDLLPALLVILGLIALATIAAPRLKLPAAVLLALAGIAWSLFPGLPSIEIAPRVVLQVFLPPLLYADAWEASWFDFRRWLRPILSLAIGLVAVTILTVGLAAHALFPGLPWAACFLLGAILAPTDTVAIHAVFEGLNVPRRATAIIGGESLVNDATGLLGVQLATTVMLTGIFESTAIGLEFARIAGLGILVGAAIGLGAIAVNMWARGSAVIFLFSLIAPYLAYQLAEHIGASGVLSVVVAGFVASWRIDVIAAESRPDLYVLWDFLTLFLNGLMFLFVGIAAPRRLGSDAASMPLLASGLIVALVVVVTRIVWFWPAAYVPLWLLPKLRRKEGGYPPPRVVAIGGWCGVRGAVSLAAAISLPVALADGTPFPGREVIQACALVTILATLIGQGATLGLLVRFFRLPPDDSHEIEVRQARESMLRAGIARLDEFCSEESCPIAVYRYRDAMNDELAELRALDENERQQASRRLAVSREVHRAVWEAKSAALLRLRERGKINDRAHQELQIQLDREHTDLGTA